jgi:hypothetical protein
VYRGGRVQCTDDGLGKFDLVHYRLASFGVANEGQTLVHKPNRGKQNRQNTEKRLRNKESARRTDTGEG